MEHDANDRRLSVSSVALNTEFCLSQRTVKISEPRQVLQVTFFDRLSGLYSSPRTSKFKVVAMAMKAIILSGSDVNSCRRFLNS